VTVNVSGQSQTLIRVGGYFGIEGTGVLRVDALNCSPPFYNICEGASWLFGQSGSGQSSMAGAVAESTTSCTGGTRPDVWFFYVPPCDGTFSFSTCGTSFFSFPTAVSFHTGCPGTEANRIACGASGTGCHGSPPPPDAGATASVTAGQGIYIRVAALASTPLPYPSWLEYQYAFTAPAPPNDACAAAIPLTNGMTFCTAGATPSPEGLTSCEPASGTGDVWFRYTAACTGTATINLCGSGFDTHLTVFAGNNCNQLGAVLACNDNSSSCDGTGSIASFAVAAGQSYLVRVGGGGNGGDGGRGTVSLTCIPTTNFNGACCINANCSIRAIGNCNLMSGVFLGFGTVCSPNPCVAVCRADINESGALTVQDIFDFLGLYFQGDRRADMNSSGGLSVQDIFDFLGSYFAGCH
jgi:hypothetical protein